MSLIASRAVLVLMVTSSSLRFTTAGAAGACPEADEDSGIFFSASGPAAAAAVL
jgi:hypothetical protein